MKILLINYEYPPNGGGAGNATREIGRALTQMGHAVTVLTGGETTQKMVRMALRLSESARHDVTYFKRDCCT